ncbi:MAG: SpoIIIAH-like family protein [Bacilli bacterium]|nr:SpoIIIAH-like family protein [Bacilli bacterium]MDD4808561.1 SpoIIIAH-like family protein [Bacilli bacterium]
MINKRSIWFLTLFSLILVLSIYYVTMPNELLLTNNDNLKEKEKLEVTINESDILVALRVEADEDMLKEIDALTGILTNTDSTVDEKNNAFEKMKSLNITRGEEESLETDIKNKFQLKSFIKVNGDQVRVVVLSKEHDNSLANSIMRTVQQNYDNKMYISVKFQK